MPQGRRKVPFSGKQKKQQLVAKRQSQKFFPNSRGYNADSDEDETNNDEHTDNLNGVQKINYQTTSTAAGGSGGGSKQGSHANRYALQFYRETDRQLRDMREESRKSLVRRSAAELEVDGVFFDGYDFPRRPEWTYRMSKEQLNSNENRYFTEYVMKLERQHTDKQLSYFELNLETWRQLWRVLEISDIVLVIVDIRYPTLMFPPSLFDHVTRVLRKDMILVLNKVDLVAPSVVLAWRAYFSERYAGISLVMFTSFPGYNLRNVSGWTRGLQIRRRRGRQRMAIEGAQMVLDACQRIVRDEVDLNSWRQKIADERRWLEAKLRAHAGIRTADGEEEDDDDDDDDGKVKCERTAAAESTAFDFEKHVRYKDGTLTVGCVGLPNVGKSSVLNALMGRKVVSVSKTPGHTKHFQTIYLTDNVRLCDCPGLVFPSAVPRPLQVLLGSYPIAQLRVPMAAVKYLAERCDLERLLNVEATAEWSALDLCEAWAVKRGFLTAKAARPDVSRAANSILRMALEGQIALCLMPIGYGEKKDFWRTHEDLKFIEEVQAFGKMMDADEAVAMASSSEDTESDVGEEDDDETEEIRRGPKIQNAFDLLNDED